MDFCGVDCNRLSPYLVVLRIDHTWVYTLTNVSRKEEVTIGEDWSIWVD